MSSHAAPTRRGLFALLAAALIAIPGPGAAEVFGVAWSEPIQVASGGGYRGPWRMNESFYDYVDDPTVAINERGFVGVAWVDQAKKDVLFQIYGPDGITRLDEPVNVSRSPRTFSWMPRAIIADAEAREIYMLWQEIVFSGGSHGGEIFFARSTDGGRSFNKPINLSNTTAGAGKGRITARYWHNGSLDLATGPGGEIYTAWTEYEGALRFSRSADGGASFSKPLRIAGDGTMPARGPSLAVDARGIVYLAWTVGEDSAADIRLARSTDHGRSFTRPSVVLPSSGHADAPKLAVDSRGILHLVYAESASEPFRGYHIRYARSADGGRTFGPPMEISRPQPELIESANFPSMGIDNVSNIYVVWEMFLRAGRYAQGLGFVHSADGGRSFARPSVIPGSIDPEHGVTGGQQGLLARKLAVNGKGAIAAVQSTYKPGSISSVWLWRGRSAVD